MSLLTLGRSCWFIVLSLVKGHTKKKKNLCVQLTKYFFLDLFWFSFIAEPFLAYSETWFIDVPSNFFFCV